MNLDSTFGLVPDAGGMSRAADSWAYACDSLGVPAERRTDARAIADAVSEATDIYAATTMAALSGVVESAGHDAAATDLAPVAGQVLVQVPASVLERLLRGLEVPPRAEFIRAVTRTLEPAAVLATAVAGAASFGAPISAALLKLLQKLQDEAATLAGDLRVRADNSFRSLILHLVDAWTASFVSSATGSFESMFAEKPVVKRTRLSPEPMRVIQLALEADAVGSAVWAAIAEQSRDEEGLRELFTAIRSAPADRQSRLMIADQVATPARLTALLHEDPIDFEVVDVIVARLGMTAARPLLDTLVDAKLRSTRRALMDRLVRIGPDIAPLVAERLEDPRWFVVRNMIALLRETECSVAQIPLDRFNRHEDGRVRRETLQLELEDERLRDDALARALADTDRHVLRTALQAARTSLPESAVPALAARVTSADFPPEFRVMSLYLLGRCGSISALDTLLAFAQGGTSLFGKPKLAPKTPEMLAALGGLARSWPNERRAAVLLDIARKSKDEQIMNALQASQS